jgi:hypothetical protein
MLYFSQYESRALYSGSLSANTIRLFLSRGFDFGRTFFRPPFFFLFLEESLVFFMSEGRQGFGFQTLNNAFYLSIANAYLLL